MKVLPLFFILIISTVAKFAPSSEESSLIWPDPIPKYQREKLIKKYLHQTGQSDIPELIFCIKGFEGVFQSKFENEDNSFKLAKKVVEMLSNRQYVFLAKLTAVMNSTTTPITSDTKCDYEITIGYSKLVLAGYAAYNKILINLTYILSVKHFYIAVLHEIGHIFTLLDDYENPRSMMRSFDYQNNNQVIFKENVVQLYTAQLKYYTHKLTKFHYNMLDHVGNDKNTVVDNHNDGFDTNGKYENDWKQPYNVGNIDDIITELENSVNKLKQELQKNYNQQYRIVGYGQHSY